MKKPPPADPSLQMPLLEFIERFYMQTEHKAGHGPPGKHVAYYLRRCVKAMAAVVGRPPILEDLTNRIADAMVDHMRKVLGYKEKSIEMHCERLAAVWRYAGDMAIVLLPWELRRGKKVDHPSPLDKNERFPLVDSPQTLWGICLHDYFPKRLEIRSEETRRQYNGALRQFAKHLGRQPVPSDLNDDTVVAWVKAMQDAGGSIYSIRERLGRVLTLWTWLAKRRRVETFPTISRPSGPEPEPFAWTEGELAKLFDAASRENGDIAGIPGWLWWPAWLAFVFNTGERYGAARQLRWKWVNLETGVVTIPATVRKGGKKRGVYTLWPEVIALLRKIEHPKRDLVFPFPWHAGSYYNHFNRILKRAGLPHGRKQKTHCLRATHATMKTVLGVDASRALGHSDAATTRRHYIDVRHLPADNVRLPLPLAAEQPLLFRRTDESAAVIAIDEPTAGLPVAKRLPSAGKAGGR